MRKDYLEFKLWTEDFIEYHFYKIVEHQGKSNVKMEELGNIITDSINLRFLNVIYL